MRASSGKRLAISPRDLRLFGALARYRYLPVTYLFPLAGGRSETRFKERLGDLFHEGFLDRPKQQWFYAESNWWPIVYELDSPARVALVDSGVLCAPATFLGDRAHRQFAHARMICECLASIELATLARQDVRFIPWPEILARAPATTQQSETPFKIDLESASLIPDGLFGLEYRSASKSLYRFFALEADRGTMPVSRSGRSGSSLLRKCSLYSDLIARGGHKSRWGISNLFVLVVTQDPFRIARTLELLSRTPTPRILFKAKSETDLLHPSNDLLLGNWQRAGFPELSIASAS